MRTRVSHNGIGQSCCGKVRSVAFCMLTLLQTVFVNAIIFNVPYAKNSQTEQWTHTPARFVVMDNAMPAVSSGEFAMTHGYSGDICPDVHCAGSPFNGIGPQEELCPSRGLCPRDICPVGFCQQDAYTRELCPDDMCEEELRPHDGNQNLFYPVHIPEGEQYLGDTYPRELCQQFGLGQNGISPGSVPPEGQYVGEMCPRETCQRGQGLHAQDLPACAYDNASYPLPGSTFVMFHSNPDDGEDDYVMMNGGQVCNI